MARALKISKILAALALAVFVAACAAPQPAGPSPESLLTAAGFKTIVASTDKQLQNLPTLPAGQVTVIDLTGKTFYVYPDLVKNQLFVGNEKTYRAYLNLRAQNNMPEVDPEKSYFKQDKGLQKTDTRDASIPWWDAFPQIRDQELP
jgi:hypothetical protein